MEQEPPAWDLRRLRPTPRASRPSPSQEGNLSSFLSNFRRAAQRCGSSSGRSFTPEKGRLPAARERDRVLFRRRRLLKPDILSRSQIRPETTVRRPISPEKAPNNPQKGFEPRFARVMNRKSRNIFLLRHTQVTGVPKVGVWRFWARQRFSGFEQQTYPATGREKRTVWTCALKGTDCRSVLRDVRLNVAPNPSRGRDPDGNCNKIARRNFKETRKEL